MPVFVVGGPSNVGKTTAAVAVGRTLGCDVFAVDDLARASTHPALAFERDDTTWARPPAELVQLLIDKGAALWPAVADRIARARSANESVIIEGEGPSPASVASCGPGALRGAFIVELEAAVLDETLRRRSAAYRLLPPDRQASVVAMNVGYGQWLKRACDDVGVPWLPSQPWETLTDRPSEAWKV